MPLPDNSYYPLFPVQEQIVDSTNGLPLAAGTVYFYRDTNRSVPKNVYQRTENPDNTFTYVNLGSVLVLSSIGTFVDPSGNNIIPFLWPFFGLPTDTPPSTVVDLYYIIVQSSDGIQEFTVSAWPPEVSPSSSTSNDNISSTNIISNPQFAIINYPSPTTFTVSGNSTIRIAPDWNVITAGSGSFTISQIAVNDTSAPGLPAFALEISTTGVSALLSQRITMSPRILETGYASGTFIIESNLEAPQTVLMNYVPSDPALTTQTVCTGIGVNGSYTATYGTVNLASLTTNPDSGNVGYVDVQLTIPINSDVNISCVQLISVANSSTSPTYIQESTPRQIDHIYHYAYPIVPIGTVIDYAGFGAPSHYLLCNGAAYSRITYNQLFLTGTLSQTITKLSSTTFTVTSAAQLGLGMFVEGAGIPVGTYITVISGTTITVNQATTSTGSFTARFFAFGQGDGSTTFNVPNLTGKVTVGSGGNIVAISPLLDALGQSGGSLTTSVTLAAANMPPQVGVCSTTNGGNFSHTATGTGNVFATSSGNGTFSQGANTAITFNVVQPTTIVYKYIRYE